MQILVVYYNQDKGKGKEIIKMTNRQAREIAKDILQDTIGVAYYKLNESFKYEDLTEEEKDMINCFLTQYAISACKAFRRDYITY